MPGKICAVWVDFHAGFCGQFRITGNTMAFTDDNWKSVRVAIGENTFRHPLTESKETQYGIFAENIIGNLIAGEKMYIGNKEGNVFITESGIRIGKGTISWDGVNPPGMEDIGGLTEFKHKVNAALTGSPTTEIGSDYVFPASSPFVSISCNFCSAWFPFSACKTVEG